jgi:hypothetical protein
MALIHIETITPSGAAGAAFTIDGTYNEYQFFFSNIHPAADFTNVDFQFQVNAVGESDYNELITSTQIQSYHNEGDSAADVTYYAGRDQAQGDAYQSICSYSTKQDDDSSVSGKLTLYAPSSTTYVKHFVADGNGTMEGDYSLSLQTAGYINTTAAIDDINFKMNGGTMHGIISMYGVG